MNHDRSAITGQYVNDENAKANPDTTVTEHDDTGVHLDRASVEAIAQRVAHLLTRAHTAR